MSAPLAPDSRRTLILIGAWSGLLFALGLLLRQLGVEPGPPWRAPFLFARSALLQLSLFVLVATAGMAVAAGVARLRARTLVLRPGRWLLGLAVPLAVSLATGELLARAVFWEGMSFGSRAGPIVERFERDFVLNRYDGPSRGPEIAGPGSPRVLVQGDSITWGQGVKSEADLFTTRLLARLRESSPAAQMAVLARPGREIDGHLEQLRGVGAAVAPDVVIYQWFLNDIELSKAGRPRVDLPWQRLFFHGWLRSHSYFWFFLDFSLARLVPVSPARTYTEYLLEDYRAGSAGWLEFEGVFRDWAAEARGLTPRVLVALYPRFAVEEGYRTEALHLQMRELAREVGVELIDLASLLDEFAGDYDRLKATRFDGHPSAAAHAWVADRLYAALRERWPELLRAPDAPAVHRPTGPKTHLTVRRGVLDPGVCPLHISWAIRLGGAR